MDIRRSLSPSLAVASGVRQVYCQTWPLMNGVLWVKKRKREKKRTTHLRAPSVVKPHSGPIMVVPLPL